MTKSQEQSFKYADSETRVALIAQDYVITDDDMRILFWEVFEYATFDPVALGYWEDEDWNINHKTNTEQFEFYLKNGANPNIKIPYRRLPKVVTPILSIVVWYGLLEVVELLLKYGADIEATSEIGWTAWMYAKQLGKTEIVELLEKNGATKYDLSAQALIKAAEQQDIETVKKWLAKGVDIDLIDEKGETALYKSVTTTSDFACANVLIEAGATINLEYKASPYKTLLERIIMNLCEDKKRKKQFVQQLLSVTNSAQHLGGFYQAAAFKQYEIADLIFTTTNTIFKTNSLEFQRLVQKACFVGDMEMLEYLIEKKADLNQNTPHYFKETPLTLAISKQHFEIVKRLLEAGANPNLKNGKGERDTPLEICALRSRERQIEIGVLLVKHGADMSIKNKENQIILTKHQFQIDFAKAVKAALEKID